MKIYRHEQYGIALEIPDEWSEYVRDNAAEGNELIFKCRTNEAFHIQIAALAVLPLPYQVENEFRRFAEKKGATSLVFGRCTADGREHVWARFYLGYGQWLKKYRVILRGFEYMLTAACLDEKSLLEMEKDWDKVASSFCLIREDGDSETAIPEQRSESQTAPVQQKIAVETPVRSTESVERVKTYRNEKHGFEIEMPEGWSPPPAQANEYMNMLYPIPAGMQKDVFQYGCYEEAFNFEIAPLFPEPLLADTEVEFRLFARDRRFKDLRLGRISVAGKEHVCASYYIDDEMGVRWNKKYMIVLGGVEYAITGTCNEPQWFAKREKDWDTIIRTFRLLKPVDDSANLTDKADRYREQRREVVQERIHRRDALGDLYAKAYEAVSMGRFVEARALLEKCLQENPNHVLAHKELALVLERLGDKKGAIAHRQEVARIDPSDMINKSKLERLLGGTGSRTGLPDMGMPAPKIGGFYYGNPVPSTTPHTLTGTRSDFKQPDTLRFSIISYLLITTFSALYIHFKVGFDVLFSLNNENHPPLSESEFSAVVFAMILGIGASVCLFFLLGIVTNGRGPNDASTFFGFVERTMQNHDRQNRKIGEVIFSDYTRKSRGMLAVLSLQFTSVIHSLIKIFLIPFSVGQLNFFIMSAFALLLFLQSIWQYPTPVLWTAIYAISFYYLCYRAFLIQVARLKGVSRDGDVMQPIGMSNSPSLTSFLKSTKTTGVTPSFITEILNQESIVNVIRNDLNKTDQIGYKEVWRLGLITPDQDIFDPRPDTASRAERTRKYIQDNNYRYKWMEQIPLQRTAALHSTGYFNVQLKNLLISNGLFKPRGYPGWSYHLHTDLNPGEFIRIRNIQIETDRPFAKNRSSSLARFLREDGFPLKESYPDGDPLTTERGGIVVLDGERVLIAYPKYLTQRRLIDDEGNLVDIGIDEGHTLGGIIEVKMHPAVLSSFVQYAASHRYTPILRYHSVPYASEYRIPILDTPISVSGWADLFLDTRGKGKLFITREKTTAEWYEMMMKLKQLFYDELARKDYHVLGLAKDKVHLNSYLSKKMKILEEYYIIQDWNVV